MDATSLKEFLESDEGKTAIQAAADKEVEPLKNKNSELLDLQKKLKEKLDSFDGIDPSEYQSLVQLKRDLDEKKRQQLADDGDHDKIIDQMKKDFAKSEKEKEDLIESLTNENRQLIISGSLSEAMSGANIAAPYQEAFLALIGNKVAVTDGEDGKQAVIGDKTVSEFVAEFVGTDQGKHFVKAPGSSGGGSSGSTGTGAQATNPFAGEKPDLAAGADLMRKDPVKARQLMKDAGMPALEDS